MPMILLMGICLTLAGNIMSYSYHNYQAELFPTGIRARAVGFVYSWSRLSAVFTAFIIAFVLQNSGRDGRVRVHRRRDGDRHARRSG